MTLTSTLGTPLSVPGHSFVLGAPVPVFEAELDVFSSDPGIDAGRIPASAAMAGQMGLTELTPFVFCLGHLEPEFYGSVEDGTIVTIDQSGTLASVAMYLQCSAMVRVPSSPLPAGGAWQIIASVNGGNRSVRTLNLPGTIAWTWFVDLYGLSSVDIAFSLGFYDENDLPGDGPPTYYDTVNLEIPALFIGDVVPVYGVASQPVIANQNPVDQQGIDPFVGPPVPVNATIAFDVFLEGDAQTASSVNVLVNSVPAVVNGSAQSGFSVSLNTTYADIIGVVINSAIPFDSDSTVYVAAHMTGHSTSSWSFQTQDIVPPVILNAVAVATNVVRVTWSKHIELASPAGAHDGLNPSLYYVQAVQPDSLTPAVSGGPVGPSIFTPPPYITVFSVVTSFPSENYIIDLTFSDDLSPGIPYYLTQMGVADLVGNTTTSVASFVAFTPPDPPGRDFSLWQLLPEQNRVEDQTGDLRRVINCAQEVAGLLIASVDAWTNVFDPTLAAEPFLDAMLADLGNPFPFPMTELQKRQLIQVLPSLYQQKGTAQGIIDAVLLLLGLTVTISTYSGIEMRLGTSLLGFNWILGPNGSAAAYSFTVNSTIALTALQIQQITFIANYMKAAHEHLVRVQTPTVAPLGGMHLNEVGILLGDNWILNG